MLEFRESSFDDLDLKSLYEILQRRSQVFVVEQQSIYLDQDGRDPAARHLVVRSEGRFAGYARWYQDGAAVHLGRVLVLPEFRGRGVAKALVRTALERLDGAEIVIEAQCYLERFYAAFGFLREGSDFILDGIPHLPMRRPASTSARPADPR